MAILATLDKRSVGKYLLGSDHWQNTREERRTLQGMTLDKTCKY